jgi:hypothetical protein
MSRKIAARRAITHRAGPNPDHGVTHGKAETEHTILPFPHRAASAAGAPDHADGSVIPFPDAYWTPERVARHLQLATKALPFVKIKPDDRPGWLPESYWNVTPTGHFTVDREQGREYARLAIAAMSQDRNAGLLGWIVHDMIRDAVARESDRRTKRRIKSTGALRIGFLDEVGEILRGRC